MLLARKRKILRASRSAGVSSPLLDDLVSYWKLSDLTDSHGTNTLTNVNGVTFVAGKLGNAGEFTGGSGQKLFHTDPNPLEQDEDWTYAVWVKRDALDAYRYLIDKDDDVTYRFFHAYFEPAGTLWVTLVAASVTAISSPVSDANWHFIVFWHDATAKVMRVQVDNGTVNSSNPWISYTLPAVNVPVNIGRSYDGLIDDVALWRRVLTSEERTQLYNSGNGLAYPFNTAPAPQPFNGLVSIANLVSYWKLDEASGNRLDSHGTNHLTPTNSPVGAAGKIGNGCDFERDNSQYLSHADPSPLGDEDFTYAFWYKGETLSPGGFYALISKGGFDSYWITVNDASQLEFAITGRTKTVVTSMTLDTNWHFIVVWHDSIANTINISRNNGTPASAPTAGAFPTATGYVLVGSAQGGYHFDGLIDEVSLWRRVLTPAERTALYNSGNGLTY